MDPPSFDEIDYRKVGQGNNFQEVVYPTHEMKRGSERGPRLRLYLRHN